MSSPKAPDPSSTPLTSDQRRLLIFLSAATFFEGFDFLAITQVLPHVRADFGLSQSETGLLVGVANIGPILACFIVRLIDRIGRRKVMQYTLLGYAGFTLASGLAPDPYSFAIAQLLARMFLVGEWATSMVYAAESFPAERRGQAIGIIQGVAALGAVTCGGVAPLLMKLEVGWRAVYFFGAIPVVILLFARRNLKETERFLAVANAEQNRRALWDIVRGPHRLRVLTVALLWWLVYVGTHNATTFWKEFAMTERGMTDGQVGVSLTIAAVCAMPFVFAVGPMLDRLGRRGGAAIIYPVAALGVLGAFTLTDRVGLTIAMALTIFGASAVLPVVEAYTTELFPTELRGDAFAWANNLLGRLGPVLSPPLVGIAAEHVGWGPAVATTSVANILALILIWAALPETRGRELEDISGSA